MDVFTLITMHPLLAGLWAVLAILFSVLLSDVYNWYYLPRGPFPLPFIGNILSITPDKFYVRLKEWSHAYGPMYTIWIGRSPRIIVTDPKITSHLLSRRGNKYSSRPRMIVFGELFNDGASVAAQPYGHAWSLRRKLLHNSLKSSALPAYKPRQEAEAMNFIADIAKDSSSWSEAIDRFAASVVFSLAYGRRIASLDSKTLKKRQFLFRVAAKIMAPGAYLVETLPYLLHLPDFLSRWKEYPLRMGRELAAFDISLVDAVKEDVKEDKGMIQVSLTETMLDLKKKGEAGADTLAEAHFAAIPAVLFGAGSETTNSTLHSAVNTFVTHPHVQHAAQAEIDKVVGQHRSPTFGDQANLPYIDALVKEILRWRPAAVFGVPHATSEADTYNDYRIPKGTVVWPAAWGLNQNAEYFPSPNTFAPERYLPASDSRFDSKIAAKPFPPGCHPHASFGFGRRACAGADLATNSLFIVLAKLLWAFDVKPAEGQVYDTDAYEGGMVLRPKPFKCEFVVRDAERNSVLEREMVEAQMVLDLFPPFE
ncbi:cytochrome P450 [Cadophora sp. MPI-SDFR-AT-0126]|nr:cytochrome P450 [Leotiomycetes sp. MPI-SDFR-AT-0126]